MEEKTKRHQALDALRGLTVLFMIPVNAGLDFPSLPAWTKHAPGAGMRLADFIMPAFLVALGFSSSLSLGSRLERYGLAKTTLHAFWRYGLLFVFGTIGYVLVWQGGSWEVLQMLGATGALAFPFLFLPPLPRILAAFLLAGLVEALRPAVFASAYQAWHDSGLGGPAGTFALASLPIAASALGELTRGAAWKRRAWLSAGSGLSLIALGLLASALLSLPDKHLLTPAYLLISGGAACLGLALLELPCARVGDIPVLGPMGRNPLFGYMGSGILILVSRTFVPQAAPAPLAWATVVAILIVIVAASLVMDRKGIWIRL